MVMCVTDVMRMSYPSPSRSSTANACHSACCREEEQDAAPNEAEPANNGEDADDGTAADDSPAS